MPPARSIRGPAWALLLCALACQAGPSPRPRSALAPKATISELELHATVMAMADEHIAALGEAVYLVVRNAGIDGKGRWLALSFLRNGTGATIDIGASANPAIGLLDLLVLGSLQTWAFEHHWIGSGIGEAAGRPALERLQAAEARLWASAAKLLSPEQIAALEGLIADWIEHNPDRMVVSLVRFKEFMDERRLPQSAARERASWLLQGISDATAVVEDATLLGERALWFASRFPYVLGQQAELTAYRIADQPEVLRVERLLEVATELGTALSERLRTLTSDLAEQQTKLFAQLREERVATVEHLASRFADEREALISRAFDRLAQERKALFDDLETREATLRPTLTELGAVIRASDELTRQVAQTADAVDRVVARFDPGASATGAAIDLREVHATATEAGTAAARLTTVLDRLNETLDSPRLDARLQLLESSTAGLVDRLFWRALWLVLILIAGLAGLKLIPAVRGKAAGNAEPTSRA